MRAGADALRDVLASAGCPSGWTRPLVSSRTEARAPTRSASAPTTCGSAFEGTAKQIRSTAGELDVGRLLDVDRVGELDAGQVVLVLALARDLGGLVARRACRAGPRARPRRAGRRRRCPSFRRRSRRPCAAAAARRATPTAARCSARSARSPLPPAPATGRSVRGKVIGLPAAQADLARADAPAAANLLGADHRDGQDRGAGLQREAADAALRPAQRAAADPGALGEDDDGPAALDAQAARSPSPSSSAWPRRIGKAPRRFRSQRLPARLEELDLGDELHPPRPRQRGADHEGVEEAAVVRGDDQPALELGVLAAVAVEPQPDQEGRDQEAAGDEVEDAVVAVLARERW